MPLNTAKGNMYSWVTHTWNTIKGQCSHDCTYCYMKRWGKLNPVRFDTKELKTGLGSGNFIFVGSSCDMWAKDIPEQWIKSTLDHCAKFDNIYLFQTKNPANIRRILPEKSRVCVTLETNRHYPDIMRNCPQPWERVMATQLVRHEIYITIEPIMEFDVDIFARMLKSVGPIQVNIGADSGRNNLPEPSAEKIYQLIERLKEFTVIDKKSNLSRILNK
jgi:DNA repair photolyase